MYERKIGDRTLTLGNDRWKIQESLVLYDVETGTQWVQASGKSFRGELAGQTLKPLPVELTRFSAYRSSHPDAELLTGQKTRTRRGRIDLLDRDRLDELLLVGRVGAASRAYPLDLLDRHGLVEDSIDATPVAAVLTREPDVMRLYRRQLGGKTLALELLRRPGMVVLRERGGIREWDAATGRALGEAGEPSLEALPAVPLRRPQLRFHFPQATLWEEPPPKRSGS